jgi:hypothetical protein
MTICLTDEGGQMKSEWAPWGQLVIPVCHQQHDWPMPEMRSYMAEQIEAGRIGPVEVFEDDESGTVFGDEFHETSNIGIQSGLVRDWRQLSASEDARRIR